MRKLGALGARIPSHLEVWKHKPVPRWALDPSWPSLYEGRRWGRATTGQRRAISYRGDAGKVSAASVCVQLRLGGPFGGLVFRVQRAARHSMRGLLTTPPSPPTPTTTPHPSQALKRMGNSRFVHASQAPRQQNLQHPTVAPGVRLVGAAEVGTGAGQRWLLERRVSNPACVGGSVGFVCQPSSKQYHTHSKNTAVGACMVHKQGIKESSSSSKSLLTQSLSRPALL